MGAFFSRSDSWLLITNTLLHFPLMIHCLNWWPKQKSPFCSCFKMMPRKKKKLDFISGHASPSNTIHRFVHTLNAAIIAQYPHTLEQAYQIVHHDAIATDCTYLENSMARTFLHPSVKLNHSQHKKNFNRQISSQSYRRAHNRTFSFSFHSFPFFFIHYRSHRW